MDTESLLRSLNARDVQYVIIGATAFPVHGYARATLDIDVFIAATRENAERTLEALRDTGHDVSDIKCHEGWRGEAGGGQRGIRGLRVLPKSTGRQETHHDPVV
mgnify:CR=1 FL=1